MLYEDVSVRAVSVEIGRSTALRALSEVTQQLVNNSGNAEGKTSEASKLMSAKQYGYPHKPSAEKCN